MNNSNEIKNTLIKKKSTLFKIKKKLHNQNHLTLILKGLMPITKSPSVNNKKMYEDLVKIEKSIKNKLNNYIPNNNLNIELVLIFNKAEQYGEKRRHSKYPIPAIIIHDNDMQSIKHSETQIVRVFGKGDYVHSLFKTHSLKVQRQLRKIKAKIAGIQPVITEKIELKTKYSGNFSLCCFGYKTQILISEFFWFSRFYVFKENKNKKLEKIHAAFLFVPELNYNDVIAEEGRKIKDFVEFHEL